MSNDDPRGNESPDRQNASTRATRLFRERLETIDHLTTILLRETTRSPALEHLEPAERSAVRRRLREIDAETNRILLLAFGPKATIPNADLESIDHTTTDDAPTHETTDDTRGEPDA
ncbi:hypothetical protein HALLA_13340 [Halostagnicola larsenii XH-48]|uniref:Uncharacterized protein n=1 Tax=Halostagnicola larsenii XH-48 TaxID=797299 RepID=W0JLL0_9EURY|nr:hypothetical protein [Halostagnicola larsenii]AHF99625.1 hypothetical protein HALLA_13340 [Halostagnicola larsenii XH-48]